MPGASGGAPAVPEESAVAVVSPPVMEAPGGNQEPQEPMDIDTLYPLSGMNDDGVEESDSLSRMTTLRLSPSTMDALAVGGLRKLVLYLISISSSHTMSGFTGLIFSNNFIFP